MRAREDDLRLGSLERDRCLPSKIPSLVLDILRRMSRTLILFSNNHLLPAQRTPDLTPGACRFNGIGQTRIARVEAEADARAHSEKEEGHGFGMFVPWVVGTKSLAGRVREAVARRKWILF